VPQRTAVHQLTRRQLEGNPLAKLGQLLAWLNKQGRHFNTLIRFFN
jgi:hypothetical protein